MSKHLDPKHAVYVGSFDPMTLGHEDIVQRGAQLFSRLTVAIGINPDKTPFFTLEERMHLLRETLKDLPNVEVKCFSGLAVDFFV